MKALFAGLGSIGSRHLKNLRAVCGARALALQVTALRSSNRPLAPDIAALVDEECRTLPAEGQYDLAFVTAPTHLHALVLEGLKGRAGCLFIEKPVFEAPGYDLYMLGLGPEQKAYVAAPMRWTALYAALKETLQKTPVYSARAICSSYLPGWRPGVNYRENYSANKAMGGGVTLDLIHEWDYLVDLFGFPQQCCNLRGKTSHLEIDSDDISIYIARYPQLLCEVHLDYFGRQYRRTLELFCEAGTIVADFGAGTLCLPNPGGTTRTEDYGEDANRRYEREMAWFLDYAAGLHEESLNSPANALRVLQVALQNEEETPPCQSD